MSFSRMVSKVLVLRGVAPTLVNGYGIYRQNYAALVQGSGMSEMSAGLQCRNKVLGILLRIYYFRTPRFDMPRQLNGKQYIVQIRRTGIFSRWSNEKVCFSILILRTFC